MSPIGDWPLLQHVPDLISIGLGATTHPDARQGPNASVGQAAWFWGFLFIVLSGPILVYARTTYGEMLATGLLVCLVAATLLQAPPPVVALAALAACLTKETAYSFVAALGLLGLVLARRRTGRPIRRHVVWGSVGLAIGIVLASLLNIVRFGSAWSAGLQTPGSAAPWTTPLPYSWLQTEECSSSGRLPASCSRRHVCFHLCSGWAGTSTCVLHSC